MKPDLKKLTELADFVDEHVSADKLDMHWFAMGDEAFSLRPSCPTTACLGGVATLLWPNELHLKKRPEWPLRGTGSPVYDIVHTPSGEEDFEGLGNMFGLSRDQVLQVFDDNIPSDEAISNLRRRIKEWAQENTVEPAGKQ